VRSLDCKIDKNLVDILGNRAVHAIYEYLDNNCGLRREEIPVKMDLFETELEKLLGQATRIIIRRIKQEIAQEPEK
jgi:hypothetical protein